MDESLGSQLERMMGVEVTRAWALVCSELEFTLVGNLRLALLEGQLYDGLTRPLMVKLRRMRGRKAKSS